MAAMWEMGRMMVLELQSAFTTVLRAAAQGQAPSLPERTKRIDRVTCKIILKAQTFSSLRFELWLCLASTLNIVQHEQAVPLH